MAETHPEDLTDAEVRELLSRERERMARQQGRAPEGSDRELPSDAADREINVQSGDPDLRDELEAQRPGWPRPDTARGNTEGPSAAAPNTGEEVEDLVNRIDGLAFNAQLGVLRTIAARIMGQMDARDREGFIRDLQQEIDREAHGEGGADVRRGH